MSQICGSRQHVCGPCSTRDTSPCDLCIMTLCIDELFSFSIWYLTIQYGYIIEAAISYYPIRNGWEIGYGKICLFYYKTIQDCRYHDLQNLGLKIHNFSLELKQSKTPPVASCWIISTLVWRYVFCNPRCCKSWDCPTAILGFD